jgi:hypothetical protein
VLVYIVYNFDVPRFYHDATATIIDSARCAPRIIVTAVIIENTLRAFFDNAKIELFKIASHVVYLINHNLDFYSHIYQQKLCQMLVFKSKKIGKFMRCTARLPKWQGCPCHSDMTFCHA